MGEFMKKISKRGIFLFMTVIVLIQYISPLVAIANTTENTDLIALNSAKVVDQDDQTVTVDLKATANNTTAAAQKGTITLDNPAAVVKEVVNKTTTSQNSYKLNKNVIAATIAATVNQEVNDIQVKLDKASLKDISTLQVLSGNSKTDLDLSSVKQVPAKEEKSSEAPASTTESSKQPESTSSKAPADASKESKAPADTTTKRQLRDVAAGPTDIGPYLPASFNNGSIFDNINLVYKDKNGNAVDPSNFPADGSIDFQYTWSIPNKLNGYDLKDGDYYTFKLPEGVSYRPGTGTLGDYGDYIISSDGTVKFTFKNVSDKENINGTFYYNQATITTNTPGETTIIVPTKDGHKEKDIIIKPTGGTDIAKTGKFDKANNPTQIFWDVTVNTNGSHLQNASVTDAFPDGNTYSSVVVYPLTIDNGGNVTGKGDPLVAGVDYTVDSDGKVTFTGQYADTYKAFQISYTTNISDDKKLPDGGTVDFKNTATLHNGDKDLDASAQVTANYGKLLNKGFDGVDGGGSQILNWHIDYNAGEKKLPAGTTFVDTLEGKQVFTGTPFLTDVDGNPIDPSLYVITYSADNKQMTVAFPNGLDKQIKVAYKSQITGPIDDAGQSGFKNTVTSGDQSSTSDAGTVQSQGLVKSVSDVDYTDRTVTWKLDINKGRQEMSNWSLDELIPAGLTVDKTSYNFTDVTTGQTLTYGTDYEVNETADGFTITFLGAYQASTSDQFAFTFKTAFEVQQLPDGSNKWTNNAVMNWTDKSGTKHTNKGQADFEPRHDYPNDGSKGGSYNPVTKAITWRVYVNLNQRTIVNGSITDPIPDDQDYVPGSAVLYAAEINKGGDVVNYKPSGATPTYDEATKTVSVKVPEGTKTAYVLVLDTSLKGKVIDKDTYNNSATYTNDGKSYGLDGSVSVSNGGNLAEKSGQQDPTDSAYALWDVWVNKAQSTLKDVTVTDVPSNNQVVLPESIVVYGSTIGSDGSVSVDKSKVLVKDTDYSVNLDTDSTTGNQTLVVKFLKQIDTAYSIQYRSFINSPLTNDTLSNAVTVTGNGEKKVKQNVQSSTQVVNNGGSSNATNVNLIINKVDQDDSTKVLAGVKFELYAISNGGKGGLLRSGTTDDNGQIKWGNLKSGDYILVETAAASGYDIPADLAAGKKITIDGSKADEDKNVQITETNAKTKTPVTSVKGTKVWDDSDNAEGLRPTSITVHLLADGKELKSTDVTEATNWAFTFDNLPKTNEDGSTIVYTVTEDTVTGYTSSIDQSDLNNVKITNSRTPETISVKGTKTWDDSDNQDKIRPDSITVNLLANGTKVDSKVVKATDNWTYEFDNLAKYKDGQEITYTITEDSVDKYQPTYKGYDITNSYTPGKTSVGVTKAWDDANNQDGIRPNSVEVALYADGVKTDQTVVLNDANNWTASFSDLDAEHDGKAIVYTVKETSDVPGYTATVSDENKGNIIITNTHTPEVTTINGSKTWDDSNNQDGVRPQSINVNLLADGTKVASKTVSATDKWNYSFENLPKYKAGQAIVYTITEDTVPGYTTTVDGYNLTNKRTTDETSLTVTKSWNDNNNQDGIRPDSIKVQLYADDKAVGDAVTLNADNKWTTSFTKLPVKADGKDIVYTVKEVDDVKGYTTTINDSNKGNVVITNTHTPEVTQVNGAKTWDDKDNQDGVRPDSIKVNLLADGTPVDSKTVTADDNWSYSFVDLPKFNNGKAIVYTITEDSVAGYSTKVDGNDLTNTRTPDETSVTVTKSWNDSNNQDGIRPDSIKVQLYANGTAVGDAVTLNADNKWTTTFSHLDLKAKGSNIKYTVKEVDAVKGYDVTVNDTDQGNQIITNTHTPELTAVKGTKAWSDKNNQDGIRPDKITVNLLADGKVVQTKLVSAESNWTYTFDNLPKFENGKAIDYTVSEDKVPGYDATVSGYDITNTHVTETTNISVSKVWNDANNQDGLRPMSIDVQLYADGVATGSPVTLNASNDWKTSFGDLIKLDKFANGKEIVYTVKEVGTVAGYTATTDDNDKANIVITNTHTPETTVVKGTKTWSDNNNQDKIRPDQIKVNLVVNGKVIESKFVSVATNWTYTFDNLPKFEAGKAIEYQVVEDAVPGYVSTVKGFDITNTHTPGTPVTPTTPTTPTKPNNTVPSLPSTNEAINSLYGLIGFILISIAGYGWVLAKKR